jgi:hypothetical protein
MAVDTYPQAGGLDSPASSAFAITPNDGADLPSHTRALYVGSGGNLVVTLVGDTAAVTLVGLQPGYHPLRAKKVASTGTTASGLVGLT